MVRLRLRGELPTVHAADKAPDIRLPGGREVFTGLVPVLACRPAGFAGVAGMCHSTTEKGPTEQA